MPQWLLDRVGALPNVRAVVWDTLGPHDIGDVSAALERGHAMNRTWLRSLTHAGHLYRFYLMLDQWRRCFETVEDVEGSLGHAYAYVAFTRVDFLWMAEHPPLVILESARCVGPNHCVGT